MTSQGDRLRRVLAMVPWLVKQQRTPISSIAARFGVPEAEVLRDIGLIGMCGIPPYGPGELLEVTVDGEYVEAFDQGVLNRPLHLTADEGFAVLAAGRTLLSVPGVEAGPLSSALAKLEDALGARGGLVVDVQKPEFLAAFQDATARHETVAISYYSSWRDEVTERRVNPLVVHLSEGKWYVEARDHLSGELRRFRVDRVHSLTRTGEPFEPESVPVPDDPFTPGEESTLVVLALPPSAAPMLEMYDTVRVTPRADGRIEVALYIGGETWLARLILRAGPGTEVLAPEELRDIGAATATRVLSRYSA